MAPEAGKLPLSGRSALITGGSGAIGSGSAAALLRDGCSVTLLARRPEALERARARLLPLARGGAGIRLVPGDALVRADVQRAVATACELNGAVNVCVSTVGGTVLRPLLLHDEKSLMEELALNVQSAFLAIRQCIPSMTAAGGGSIVLVFSEAAAMPPEWFAIYSTAKAAVDALARASAPELARFRIRVNTVRPGLTRADCSDFIFGSEENARWATAKYPLGRLGEPEDIAAGIRYLAGPESSWVTAQSLSVSGGAELRSPLDFTRMLVPLYGEEKVANVLAGRDPMA